MTEKQLYPIIKSFLEQRGFKVLTEVRLRKYLSGFYSEIDILGIKDDNTVVIVECKLRNFKKTLMQAIRRRLYADYIYLAFPKRYARYVYRRYPYRTAIRAWGFGLLAVNEDKVIVLMEPIKNNAILKEILLERITGSNSEET